MTRLRFSAFGAVASAGRRCIDFLAPPGLRLGLPHPARARARL